MLNLPDYVLVETLYEGPETRVLRAAQKSSGERLVIKLPVSDSPSLRTVGRLLHEFRILRKLAQVPGVARAWGLEQTSSSAALILQDAGLRSLDRVLAERGRLPLEAALRIALGICRVLDGVHAAGIMHKDVKPQNTLVDESCQKVVLVDFGIASELAQETTEAILPEALEGTLAYISPEQTGRTARGLDTRTDLYSLGVLLFEMLSGRRPFLERDALALVYAHLAKTPPAIESLVPGLPAQVARICERCLEKYPEQRYQTAKGLAADLEQALAEWTARGGILEFALGQKDFSPRLQIPQDLVSREAESRLLTAAFERAAAGAVEVLLLGGPSGVGKTALVRSVYREIAQAGRGLLLWGKHDQLGRAVPYAALTQAFTGLLSNLAASAKPLFEAWRSRLATALGANARVIADLLPELEWLLGPLPPVPVVPTEMAYNRFKLSWIEFVRAVTDASPPLVLFLDDLQWMDAASVELLKTLLFDVGRKHLLIIAAYRDREVEPSHPLWSLVEDVEKSGVAVSRLLLGALDAESVQRWLAKTLAAKVARVRPLAEALYEKTHGNPFFLGQLLQELHRQGRVRRDAETGEWQWDQDAVERTAITDNVVELMRRKIEELPASTQELLGQAACAGHSFSLTELAVLAERSAEQAAAELWPALVAGLVIPCDGQYREAQALAQTAKVSELEAHYRFLHDRVQQAFYEQLTPEQRERTHLQIGRRLQRVFEQQGGSHQKQLEMVRHLNSGAAALVDDASRKELARLNLGGQKAAKANGSYLLQATLIEQAQRLLGETAWTDEPQLSVELALEQLEADYMLRRFADVHRRAQELVALPVSALSKLAAQELRLRAYIAAGQYEEGIRLGIAVLAQQGIRYPESSDACIAQSLQMLGECDAWFDRRREAFCNMPADASLELLLCDALEASVAVSAAIGSRPTLAAVAVMRNVRQSIERGTLTSMSPFFIGSIAQIRAAFYGDYRGSVRWAKEGEETARRLASPLFPECSFYRGVYSFYETGPENSRKYFQAAVAAATTSGSFQGTSWGLVGDLYFVDLWSGRRLELVAKREELQRELMIRSGDMIGQHYFALAASYAAFLRTSQPKRAPVDKPWLSAGSQSFLAVGDGTVAELARIQETHLFLAFGEYGRALEHAKEAAELCAVIYGFPPVTDIPLWQALAAAKCHSLTLLEEKAAPLLSLLDSAILRFRSLSEGCAQNFEHKLRLLEAERARIHGRTEDALLAYDDAIEQAHEQGFLHIEALAAEFCADFHLSAGRKRLAAQYLRQACDAYARWGALALVHHLESRHASLLAKFVGQPAGERKHGVATVTTTDSTESTGSEVLDIHTAIRAAQALASELDAQRIVAQLMQLVQENSGAEHAALLLSNADSLWVAALLSGSRVQAEVATPLADFHPVAQRVVQFVLRSRAAVLLSDATTDPRFADDPRLRDAQIRSVLAVPLLHQGRLGGLLYLEHQAAHAFPTARVNFLSILAAQGAIALENARLYTDLQAANAGLEAKVAERTAALDRALKELWSEMDLAQKIQTVLLPSGARIPGYELAAAMRPAEQVGGDYYDVFRHGEKDFVLIGDVSGHGISAGLCMMMIQTAIRTAALTLERSQAPLSPRRVLTLVNQAVESNLQQIGRDQYMTLTALCIQGSSVLYAGLHLDLLIYRAASQKVQRIETRGVWVGVVGDVSDLLADDELTLEKGDILLLFTDGYTEAEVAGRRIETEGLAALFETLARRALPPAALIAGLLEALARATVRDDVTLVALQRLPHRELCQAFQAGANASDKGPEK